MLKVVNATLDTSSYGQSCLICNPLYIDLWT